MDFVADLAEDHLTKKLTLIPGSEKPSHETEMVFWIMKRSLMSHEILCGCESHLRRGTLCGRASASIQADGRLSVPDWLVGLVACSFPSSPGRGDGVRCSNCTLIIFVANK